MSLSSQNEAQAFGSGHYSFNFPSEKFQTAWLFDVLKVEN